MREGDVREGGVYLIRQWNDMAAENPSMVFGTYMFVEGMRHLCGMAVRVVSESQGVVDLRPLGENGYLGGWGFHSGMLEPIKNLNGDD